MQRYALLNFRLLICFVGPLPDYVDWVLDSCQNAGVANQKKVTYSMFYGPVIKFRNFGSETMTIFVRC